MRGERTSGSPPRKAGGGHERNQEARLEGGAGGATSNTLRGSSPSYSLQVSFARPPSAAWGGTWPPWEQPKPAGSCSLPPRRRTGPPRRRAGPPGEGQVPPRRRAGPPPRRMADPWTSHGSSKNSPWQRGGGSCGEVGAQLGKHKCPDLRAPPPHPRTVQGALPSGASRGDTPLTLAGHAIGDRPGWTEHPGAGSCLELLSQPPEPPDGV